MMNDPILYWNAVSLETHRRDFTFEGAGDSFNMGALTPEQGGPTRTSRSLAMVHLAMHDAYKHADPAAALVAQLTIPAAALPVPIAVPNASMMQVVAGAVAGAAITVLKSQWKRQTSFVDSQFADAPGDKSNLFFQYGVDLGHAVGAEMIRIRQNDNSNVADDMTFSGQHGRHQPDPFSPGQGRLSTKWGKVLPFSIPPVAANASIHASYIADYPALNTPRYNAAVSDVKQLGGRNSANRTPDETVAGTFWGYDGPRGLGVPPRLYNQVVRAFVEQNGGNTPVENAKLFTMINVGMADAAIVAWSAKYHAAYDLWRPVVGIRAHDQGFGKGHGSFSPAVNAISALCDPAWAPLGRPGTNGNDHTKTPDFPAYPSGHATFGAVTFRLTALFFAAKKGITTKKAMNDLKFIFVSDEYNGINRDPNGDIRTYHPREFSLREAIIENALSRVYLGVHWRFDGLGAVAPDDLEGAIPTDPAFGVKLTPAKEKKLGGVPIGLEVAKIVNTKF
jgi:hypothetical protein